MNAQSPSGVPLRGRPLVIYHDNCADGIAGAWCFHDKLDGELDLFAGIYNEPPPDVTGRDVYLVDFSYSRPVVAEMIQRARSVTLIDHHESALKNLANLEGLWVFRTDVEHSGCVMAWEYLHLGNPPPVLLRVIEDRDLWRFTFPVTRSVCRGLFSYPLTVDTIARFVRAQGGLLQLGNEGDILLRSDEIQIAQTVERATRTMHIGEHSVPVANAPHWLASEIGHILSANQPFAATYWDSPKHRHFSLRASRKPDAVNVAHVAGEYGGGGHASAAGFKVDRSHVLATL